MRTPFAGFMSVLPVLCSPTSCRFRDVATLQMTCCRNRTADCSRRNCRLWMKRRRKAISFGLRPTCCGTVGDEAKMLSRRKQLRPRERHLLWLAYVEGANHKEIADSTGLRTGSVKLLLFRARRKLANMLRGNPADTKEKVNV